MLLKSQHAEKKLPCKRKRSGAVFAIIVVLAAAVAATVVAVFCVLPVFRLLF